MAGPHNSIRRFIRGWKHDRSNGRYIFFCTETQGQAVPVAAPLRSVIFKGGHIKDILRIPKGEWINPRIANTAPALTTHFDGISSVGEDQVLCVDYDGRGRKTFFIKTQRTDGSTIIKGYYIKHDGNVAETALSVKIPSGMYGEILRARRNSAGKYHLLLQIKAFGAPGGTVTIKGANFTDLGRYISLNSKAYLPVVADIDADGFAEILIPDDLGEVLCFGRDSGGPMGLRWKVPGRGMLWQYNSLMDYGISVDDIDHDGDREVIVSGSDEAGAVLFLYDHNGRMLWQRSFPEINAGEITSWDSNMAFFGTAQSSSRKHRDVIVTVQRGIAHGGKTYCLNGVNGSLIWELDRLTADSGEGRIIDSGAGGNIFSTYDIDGDGSDEVMCGYGNIVFLQTAMTVLSSSRNSCESIS